MIPEKCTSAKFTLSNHAPNLFELYRKFASSLLVQKLLYYKVVYLVRLLVVAAGSFYQLVFTTFFGVAPCGRIISNGEEKMQTAKSKGKRSKKQWCLLLVVIVTLALGWKYPFFGYSVPIVMITGIIGSFVWGRYICGNWCPRGAFLERVTPFLSSGNSIPSFFRSMRFRVISMIFLMGLMLCRGFQNPTDPKHWGFVFWSLCVVTTIVAVALSAVFKPRTWCTFCPIGTLENLIGGKKGQLLIDADSCKECELCEKSCPSYIPITSHRENGYLGDRDCLKCSECILHCPRKALSWPQ